MVATFVILVAVVAFSGALGGILYEGFRADVPDCRNGDSDLGGQNGDGNSGRDKGRKPFNFGLALAGGPAGAFVALTFLSGPFDFRFDEVHDALSCSCVDAFSDFATGLFSVIAVAIVGGYLGVRLVDRIATELLKAEVRQAQDDVRRLGGRVDIEGAIRKAERQIEKGLYQQALVTLKPPKGHTLPGEMAWLRALRGYALKRLGRMDEALREVDASIEAEETYAAWYNRACYLALQPEPVTGVLAEIQRSLANAERLARRNDGLETLYRQLEHDIEDEDLRELANEGFIKDILQRTASE